MAPATRRSSGLGSNGNSPSNLDHILEHFNQFKRKHITQNRDIIKTNALAQLRIKELEEKVLALEAEQTRCNRHLIQYRRRMERAEKAAICMRQGWQLVGAGITAMSSIEGFDALLSASSTTLRRTTPEESMYMLQRKNDDTIRPSTRITLDPNALPGGVARNVSRPPEAGLNDLAEERSAEMQEQEHIASGAQSNDLHTYDDQYTISTMSERGMHEATLDSDEDEENDKNEDDGDSAYDEGDVVSFGGDGEETIRVQNFDPLGNAPLNESIPVIETEDHSASQSRAQNDKDDENANQPSSKVRSESSHKLRHMPSIDSLSSFADDEEIELSTDDEHPPAYLNNSSSSARATSNTLPVPSMFSEGVASKRQQRTSLARKRKTPNSPDESHHLVESVACSQSEAETSGGEETGRPSRRASMRDRKSINYALPKLNTKMRKPDPIDLVPATKSETREKDASSAHDLDGFNSYAETEEGEMYPSTAEDSPRTLKGKHEVASTGNLREIRKKHLEQQRKQQEEQQEEQHHVHTSSETDKEATPSLDSERSTGTSSASSTPGANDSPRRRSSRKSQRRRSSSSAQSDGSGATAHANKTGTEEKSHMRTSDDSGMHTGKPFRHDEDISGSDPDTWSHSSDAQSDAKTVSAHGMTSTPHWTPSAMNSSHSLGRTFPIASVGTPIPKPTVRAGGVPQGNIKALKVAGRLQKASASASSLSSSSSMSGLSNHAGKTQGVTKHVNGAAKPGMPLGPAGVKGNMMRSAPSGRGAVQSRIVSAGTGSKSSAPLSSPSSTASSGTGSHVGSGMMNTNHAAAAAAATASASATTTTSTSGDPTKRNSLHAAMTSN